MAENNKNEKTAAEKRAETMAAKRNQNTKTEDAKVEDKDVVDPKVEDKNDEEELKTPGEAVQEAMEVEAEKSEGLPYDTPAKAYAEGRTFDTSGT